MAIFHELSLSEDNMRIKSSLVCTIDDYPQQWIICGLNSLIYFNLIYLIVH